MGQMKRGLGLLLLLSKDFQDLLMLFLPLLSILRDLAMMRYLNKLIEPCQAVLRVRCPSISACLATERVGASA